MSSEGKPHILKSLAFLFFHVMYLLFVLPRLAEHARIEREVKRQSTSKLILAQHRKLHPIKTLNSMLIIMFPIVPFHQGFQSQIYNSSIMLQTFIILIAGKPFCLPTELTLTFPTGFDKGQSFCLPNGLSLSHLWFLVSKQS